MWTTQFTSVNTYSSGNITHLQIHKDFFCVIQILCQFLNETAQEDKSFVWNSKRLFYILACSTLIFFLQKIFQVATVWVFILSQYCLLQLALK